MSTNTYKNVLAVGASGDVGKNILPDLLADPVFKISVLSRTDSSPSFPSNVNIIKVIYSDKLALIKALAGQDIILSAVGVEALMKNLDNTLIEAAWTPLLENMKLLKQNQSRMAYTFISTGVFLDWDLDNGFLSFDITNRSAILYDKGNCLISGSLIKNLGRAIVDILYQPELTLNERICLADATFSQQEVLALLEKYSDTKWTVQHVTTEETLKNAQEEWTKGNMMNGDIAFILGLAYSGKGACNFEDKIKNKALALERVSLKQIVKKDFQRNETTGQ